ncbi:MAG: hypothetical protein ACI4WG_02100 [Erysipelotrichaceae bacterium]
MIKKISAYLLWGLSIFCELFIITLIKQNVQDALLLSIMPLGLNITLMLFANSLYHKSLVYPTKKLSDKERQRRVFDYSLPIYCNIVCFFPSAFYYLFAVKNLEKRQRNTIIFALCFTIVWLFMVFMTF